MVGCRIRLRANSTLNNCRRRRRGREEGGSEDGEGGVNGRKGKRRRDPRWRVLEVTEEMVTVVTEVLKT